MAKYPISVLDGGVGEAFKTILEFHLPHESTVLDPTAGERLLWSKFDEESLPFDTTFSDYPYKVTWTDIEPKDTYVGRQDLFTLKERPGWLGYFDGIIYDPPYFMSVKKSRDPRKLTYGDYNKTKEELWAYKDAVRDILPNFLKPGGKLIVKCADQYVVSERKLYLHHIDWINRMRAGGLEMVDLFIYRYRRVSPTAYQVKNRPSNIIAHTYFLVSQKSSEET